MNDLHISYVLIISFVIFFLIINCYIMIEKSFSKIPKHTNSKLDILKKIYYFSALEKFIFLVNKNKYKIKIILLPLPFILFYFMDYQGWGAHGIPPREANYFKLIGITTYTRNYILPIIILFSFIFGIMGNKKISYFWFLWLITITTYVGLSSLSRAVFVTYAGIIIFICLVRYVPKNENSILTLFEKFYFMNVQTILSVLFFIAGFALISNIRYDIIFQTTEVHIAYEIFNQSYIAALKNVKFIFYYDYANLIIGSIHRFLGFYELASAVYYTNDIPGYQNFVVNFLHFNPETVIGWVHPRTLTDSNQQGGVGVDIITNLYLSGPYIIFGLILISLLFFLQRITCNKLPYSIQGMLMFVFSLLNIRYFIDGGLYTQSIMTIATYIIIITYIYFRKII